MTEATSPCLRVMLVSCSCSFLSMVLALKLCRRPRVWPTSCITTYLMAWPTISSGTFSPGLISPRACNVKAAPALADRLDRAGYVQHGGRLAVGHDLVFHLPEAHQVGVEDDVGVEQL